MQSRTLKNVAYEPETRFQMKDETTMLDRRAQPGIPGVRASKEIKSLAGYPGVHCAIGSPTPSEGACRGNLARVVNVYGVMRCGTAEPIPLATRTCIGKCARINQQRLGIFR